MAAMSYRARSGGRDRPGSASLRRSISPSPSLGSTFASRSSALTLLHRPASPTRVSLSGSSALVPSVRFPVSSSQDPHHRQRQRHLPSQQPVRRQYVGAGGGQRRTCLCSPTSHPGSFRCHLHKGFGGQVAAAPPPSSRLNERRSAMKNSLVRIGAVEGEWVRRALAALIRPSSHQQRRRSAFQPRPSRLCIMLKAGADDLR